MKKTKIKFEDIQAGDLLEVVGNLSGVKSVVTGIAFESDTAPDGEIIWMTSEGGAIVFQWDRDAIYRVEPDRTYGFDDIRQGDRVRVTTVAGSITTIVEDVVVVKVDGSANPYWLAKDSHDVVVYKHPGDGERTIEILERGEWLG